MLYTDGMKTLSSIFKKTLICIAALLWIQMRAGDNTHFSHLSTRNGLPDNDIYCIFQDKSGYLWLGANGTLTRYDGYNFQVLEHDFNNSNSVIKGPIQSIVQDAYGNCWTASSIGGLVSYDPVTLRFKRHPFLSSGQENIDKGIQQLVADNEGNLWLTTRDGILEQINIKTWRIKMYDLRRCNDMTFALDKIPICKDRQGHIWVGLKMYNRRTDAFEMKIFDNAYKEVLYTRSLLCECADDSGNIWIGQHNCIIKYNPQNKSIIRYNNQAGDITHIVTDVGSNSVWLSSNSAGLFRLNKYTGSLSSYTPDPDNRYSRVVHYLFFDVSHNLWVTTEYGMYKLPYISQNFKQFNIDTTGKTGILNPIARSLYQENDSILWVGTRGGGLNKITLLPDVKYEHYLLEPKVNVYGNNFINCIKPLEPHKLMLGTNTGFYIFDTKKGRIQKQLSLSPFYAVWSIQKDTGGYIWLGTQSKELFLYNLKSGKLISYESWSGRHGYSRHSVWSLFKDQNHNIWGGTDTGFFRICRAPDGSITFKRYSETPDKSNWLIGDNSWQFLEDKDGQLWIACSGGLNRFDMKTGRFRSFTTKDGLPSNNICSIVEMQNHNLVIGTLKGVCIFDKAHGRVVNTFYESDGLESDHLGFGVCAQSRSGEVFLGGQNGINSFFPTQINMGQDTSPVVITSFKKQYKDCTPELLQHHSATLNYDENSISFDFATLDFTNPDKNQFRYYLEGIDKGWSRQGYSHFVSYNYLPPGEYTFHLMGKNSANIWSKPASFAITISPPFWSQLWFRFSAFTIVSAFTGLLFHSIFRQQKEKRQRLESDLTALRAQLNPHFIFNSLTSLHYFITAHKEKLALEYVSNFATLIRTILQNSQSSFIRIADEIKLLELYTYMESVRMEHAIDFKIETGDGINIEQMKIPPMLIQPLIENALKHGLVGTRKGGMICIFFSAESHYIYCRVEDNGIGLENAALNKQKGFIKAPSFSTAAINNRLQKMRDRVGHSGSLILENIIENGLVKGVRATLSIPRKIRTT